jgi:hypothetical protein
MTEWENYKIKGDLALVGAKLNKVRHIVHVPTARRIIDDGKIKAGLVYDESRLNKSRISVTWVSANTWALGSIYGTVEFQFDWKKIVEGQKIYWVEAIKYNPHAYRFLLSSRELGELGSKLIEPYDPVKDDGPLRKSGDNWYCNGEFTSEFMIDDDLWLRDAIGLDFVQHNGQYCRTFGFNCPDRTGNPTPEETGGRLLAYILTREARAVDRHLQPTKENPRNPLLDKAFIGLQNALTENGDFDGNLRQLASCEKAVLGGLALYGIDQLGSTQFLLTLLESADRFKPAIKKIVQDHFDFPEWTAPI